MALFVTIVCYSDVTRLPIVELSGITASGAVTSKKVPPAEAGSVLVPVLDLLVHLPQLVLLHLLDKSCRPVTISSTHLKVFRLPFFLSRLSLILPFVLADFIRHGRHHNQAKQEKEQSLERGDQSVSRDPARDLALREAVEMIVNEERETKLKVPTYKGLEDYKLIEKVGEYVPLCHISGSSCLTFILVVPSQTSTRQ